MQNTKPFFLALETVLKNRLASDAFAQVMEESLWEFEAGIADQEPDKRPASLVRLGSICISFYRAMIKIGIRPETALEALNQAGDRLGWTALPDTTLSYCSLASYFRSKNALPICRAVFCKSCLSHRSACGLADSESEDWKAGGTTR
jgi:hypothetical protein